MVTLARCPLVFVTHVMQNADPLVLSDYYNCEWCTIQVYTCVHAFVYQVRFTLIPLEYPRQHHSAHSITVLTAPPEMVDNVVRPVLQDTHALCFGSL